MIYQAAKAETKDGSGQCGRLSLTLTLSLLRKGEGINARSLEHTFSPLFLAEPTVGADVTALTACAMFLPMLIARTTNKTHASPPGHSCKAQFQKM